MKTYRYRHHRAAGYELSRLAKNQGTKRSQQLRYDERLRPGDPAGRRLLEDAITKYGSKRQVEIMLGVGDNTLRNYLNGSVGIPFLVVDLLLTKLGRAEQLEYFHFDPYRGPVWINGPFG